MSEITSGECLRVVDHEVAGSTPFGEMSKVSAPLTRVLAVEADEAHRYLHVTLEELLIAALGRTVARAIGDGELRLAVYGHQLPIPLECTNARDVDATGALRAVHRALTAQDHPASAAPVDVFFSYLGAMAEPSLVELMPAESASGRGYALALRVYRSDDVLQMDWWYDGRRLEPSTVEELTQQFPLALIELTSEAVPPVYQDAHLAMA
ncbi:MAG: hypothetical protein WAM92_09110 [Mycobacterium sp.]